MLGKEAKRAAGKGVTYTYHFLVSADVTPTFDKGPLKGATVLNAL